MIRATGRVVDPREADKLLVDVSFRMSITELRALAEGVRTLGQPNALPWPLNEFVRSTETVVKKIVDRVDEAQGEL